jgi:hypothetical protein
VAHRASSSAKRYDNKNVSGTGSIATRRCLIGAASAGTPGSKDSFPRMTRLAVLSLVGFGICHHEALSLFRRLWTVTSPPPKAIVPQAEHG